MVEPISTTLLIIFGIAKVVGASMLTVVVVVGGVKLYTKGFMFRWETINGRRRKSVIFETTTIHHKLNLFKALHEYNVNHNANLSTQGITWKNGDRIITKHVPIHEFRMKYGKLNIFVKPIVTPAHRILGYDFWTTVDFHHNKERRFRQLNHTIQNFLNTGNCIGENFA